MKISMIVAHGKNRELGLNNKIPWHISEDFKNFKRLTDGHHVLMGRKTFESIIDILGKPLPGRTSLVITEKGFDPTEYMDVYCFNEIDVAIEFAKENDEDTVFIIGGASIYSQFIDNADEYCISEVDYEGKADTFLDPIDLSNYVMIESIPYKATDKSPAWTFKRYEKKG